MNVYAVNAYTGKKIWSFKPSSVENRGRGVLRSVVYWQAGEDKRILFTAGNLLALNAETGDLVSSFGQNGKVNLNKGLGVNPKKISVNATSPGIVYKNLLLLGSSLSEDYGAPPGYVRAYNIKSGKLDGTHLKDGPHLFKACKI